MKNVPRADRQRSRILALIAVEALTAKELAKRIHLTRDMVNVYLSRLTAEKLVHIAAHSHSTKGGRPSPRYLTGDKPDVVYIKTRASTRQDVAPLRRQQIMRALRGKPKSAAEVAERLELAGAHVRRYLHDLRAERKVHIGGWGIPTAGGYIPLYALGNKPDAPKVRVPVSERNRAYRERHRDKINARRRLRDRLRSGPQTPFSALFVVAKQYGRDY